MIVPSILPIPVANEKAALFVFGLQLNEKLSQTSAFFQTHNEVTERIRELIQHYPNVFYIHFGSASEKGAKSNEIFVPTEDTTNPLDLKFDFRKSVKAMVWTAVRNLERIDICGFASEAHFLKLAVGFRDVMPFTKYRTLHEASLMRSKSPVDENSAVRSDHKKRAHESRWAFCRYLESKRTKVDVPFAAIKKNNELISSIDDVSKTVSFESS